MQCEFSSKSFFTETHALSQNVVCSACQRNNMQFNAEWLKVNHFKSTVWQNNITFILPSLFEVPTLKSWPRKLSSWFILFYSRPYSLKGSKQLLQEYAWLDVIFSAGNSPKTKLGGKEFQTLSKQIPLECVTEYLCPLLINTVIFYLFLVEDINNF